MSQCQHRYFNAKKPKYVGRCGCHAVKNIHVGIGYNPRFCYQHQTGIAAQARRQKSARKGARTAKAKRDAAWAIQLENYNSRGGRR